MSDSGGQSAKRVRGAPVRRPEPADAAGPLDDRVRGLLAAEDGRGAATEALRELGPPVLRYLRAVLRDEEDAAEAFSRFAERLWRGLPGWRGERLRPWAFRIAWSSALDVHGEAWRRRVRRFESGEASALAKEIRTRTLVRVERQRTALEKLREALSPDEQSLLTLRIEEGLGWEDGPRRPARDGPGRRAPRPRDRARRRVGRRDRRGADARGAPRDRVSGRRRRPVLIMSRTRPRRAQRQGGVSTAASTFAAVSGSIRRSSSSSRSGSRTDSPSRPCSVRSSRISLSLIRLDVPSA